MNVLCTKTGMSANDVTNMLWNTYHPYMIWLPFVGFGLLAAMGLYFMAGGSDPDKIEVGRR